MYFVANFGNHFQLLKMTLSDGKIDLLEDATEYTSLEMQNLLIMIQEGNKACGGLRKVGTFEGFLGEYAICISF